MNRYAYVLNNPLSLRDPSGLDSCWSCMGGGDDGGGDDGGWGDDGCDPIFYDCNPPIWVVGVFAPGSPRIRGYRNLDPHPILNESLGLPPGMHLPSGDILDIFGIGSGTECEFGACGGGPSSLMPGVMGNNYHSIIPPSVLYWMGALSWAWSGNHTPVHGLWTHGNWCGAGGAGIPVDNHDGNCMMHDYCYYLAGLGPWSNIDFASEMPGPRATIQGCNQVLCDAERQIGGATANKIIGYFTLFPDNGRGCR